MNPLILLQIAGRVADGLAKSPYIPVERKDAPVVRQEVAEVLQKEIAPVMEHLTSTEPWYRSRANWSAIVAGLTPLIAIAGYNLAPEDQATIAGVLTLAGNLVAAYLARRARTATKPLGH
ncbi:hypothetical protein [Microvirga sp. TS319]|uniref:hypothetical protein n=1 Tax=Microvirga sp. TS319 TaxID=3241165 RepID=UPI003519E1E7